MPLPDLPTEASELWLQFVESVPIRDPVQKPVETRLSDATRETLVRAGDLAAQHMLAIMSQPGLFGPMGIIPIDRQLPILNLVMGRAFGAMPLGAQRVAIKPAELEAPEPEQSVQATLSMLIRQRQAMPKENAPRNITPTSDEHAA